MKKRFAVLLLAVLLAASSSTTAMAAPGSLSPFVDLAEDHWSYPYVYDLYTQGVVAGDPEGTFRGGDPVTYGETFKLILLAIGEEDPERDPEQHWAWCYIEPALSNRLMYSFDETYLDAVPSRLEVARMAARALDLTDISGETPYVDCEDGYVVELFEKGIMEGTLEEDGLRWFYPEQPITREEMSTIIWRMMNVDVTEGMFRFNNYWLDQLDGVPLTTFSAGQFGRDELGRVTYSGGYYTRGIDVSGHKREIDWNAVAADGIDFAIIRAGNRLYGKDSTAAICDDSWFDRNMQGAIAAGMDVGAYFFSSAITVEEALEEADYFLEKLEPYRQYITYPVVCDWEYLGGSNSRAYGVDARIITQCVAAFCQRVEEAGYTPMFYFNRYCGYVKFDLSKLTQYGFWFAEYIEADTSADSDPENDGGVPSSRYNFQMWQYSSKGKVAGISSDVDMNLCFVPFPGATRRPEGVALPEPTQAPEASGTPEDVTGPGSTQQPEPAQTLEPNAIPTPTHSVEPVAP